MWKRIRNTYIGKALQRMDSDVRRSRRKKSKFQIIYEYQIGSQSQLATQKTRIHIKVDRECGRDAKKRKTNKQIASEINLINYFG